MMTSTGPIFTINFHQNDGTPVGRSWTQQTADVAATLAHYQEERIPVTAAVFGPGGEYAGSAKAGQGRVLR